MNRSRRETGRQAEQLAAELLAQKGYRIIERNWRCRTGELDLIAEFAGILVIVEVRSRTSIARFGTPEEAVHFRKQAQVRETAQVYIYRHKLHHKPVRFDTVTVLMDRNGNCTQIRHLENAF